MTQTWEGGGVIARKTAFNLYSGYSVAGGSLRLFLTLTSHCCWADFTNNTFHTLIQFPPENLPNGIVAIVMLWMCHKQCHHAETSSSKANRTEYFRHNTKINCTKINCTWKLETKCYCNKPVHHKCMKCPFPLWSERWLWAWKITKTFRLFSNGLFSHVKWLLSHVAPHSHCWKNLQEAKTHHFVAV